MKSLVLVLLVVALIAGFAWLRLPGGTMTAGGGLPVAGVQWRPVSINGEPVPDDTGMYVQFEVDGNITGNAGCNRFFGSLQQSESGIEVGPLGATRRACPEPIMDRESAFLDAVQRTRGFDSGRDRVRLLDENGDVLAELVPGG